MDRIEELATKAASKNWASIVKFLNNLLIFSGGVANVIFAVQFLNFATCNLEMTSVCNHKYRIHLIAFAISIPFSLIKQLRFFITSSMIAAIFICTTVLTIFIVSLIKIGEDGANKNYNTIDLMDTGKFFGVVCFSVEGIGLMLPIRSTLKHPSKFRFLFNSVCGMITAFYFLYGVVAAYAYGPTLQSVILLNFGHSNPIIYFQSLLYSIGIFITFPYVLFPLAPSIATSITGNLDNSDVSLPNTLVHFLTLLDDQNPH